MSGTKNVMRVGQKVDGLHCSKCGSDMIVCKGPYGYFAGCAAYNETGCRNAVSLINMENHFGLEIDDSETTDQKLDGYRDWCKKLSKKMLNDLMKHISEEEGQYLTTRVNPRKDVTGQQLNINPRPAA